MSLKHLLFIGAVAGQVACTVSMAATLERIVITPSAFVPSITGATLRDTLRWINATESPQTITTGSRCQPRGPLDLGEIAPGDSVSCIVDYRFDGMGSQYNYFSRNHCPGLEGVLVIGPTLPAPSITWGLIRFAYR